jgi:hypothetical protein
LGVVHNSKLQTRNSKLMVSPRSCR